MIGASAAFLPDSAARVAGRCTRAGDSDARERTGSSAWPAASYPDGWGQQANEQPKDETVGGTGPEHRESLQGREAASWPGRWAEKKKRGGSDGAVFACVALFWGIEARKGRNMLVAGTGTG
ncbi:hypothetical protein CCMA1212_009254 [Trichoderma ghanense]|uniref:Uncharacterized protein n=1 Tax=Trichoderma ghanense TaxID=65468 RepID=A0ABY2GTV8_9HYPO